MEDLVNSPSHYASGTVECIDAIEAAMTNEAFRGYLKGNIQKYLWRYEDKDNVIQDLKKAEWYLKRLIASCERHGPWSNSSRILPRITATGHAGLVARY